MYQDVKVAVISGDTFFSNALCALFRLEQIACAALKLEDGLTYANHQSNGCIVVHAETGELLRNHVDRWLECGVGVVVLSQAISAGEARSVLTLEPAAVLEVPVNSRHLLDVVYATLVRVGGNSA